MTARRIIASQCLLMVLGGLSIVRATTFVADPSAGPGDPGYYRDLVDALQPGDTLTLPAGTYGERLNLNNLQGTPGAWITITGPDSGPPAIVTTESNCCNLVQLGNTEYVAIRNLVLDSNSDGVPASIDAVNAKDGITHDILLENCTLQGLSYHQATVGVSTKSTAWNWTIRGNTIVEAGTGLYLGDPGGAAPFVAGMIEGNLIVDSIGYNIEIKHQSPYTPPAGMPPGPHQTVIRNNVFLKRIAQADWPDAVDGGSRISGARPNLLVSGFPNSGPGSDDLYEIYGNFFYRNPDESLLQASGRVAIHDNIFVGASDTSIRLQHHDLVLKLAYVYNNTIYAGAQGIRFSSSATEGDAIVGNLVFASSPISGSYRLENLKDNVTDSVANAASYVANPSLVLGQMDFYPNPGQVQGDPLDLSVFSGHFHYDMDFNGDPKADFRFRGAYAGEGENPGWGLTDGLKVGGPGVSGEPPTPPEAPTNLRVD